MRDLEYLATSTLEIATAQSQSWETAALGCDSSYLLLSLYALSSRPFEDGDSLLGPENMKMNKEIKSLSSLPGILFPYCLKIFSRK